MLEVETTSQVLTITNLRQLQK